MIDVGHVFRRPELLEEALVTPAYRMQFPDARDNQRLEFLGDAVLGLLAAERLFGEFTDANEGMLTTKRANIVSSAALCRAAERIGLEPALKRNRGAGELPRGAKTLADAVEAVIGAAYLDGGLEAARTVFDKLQLESGSDDAEWGGNPKGELQMRAQAMKPPRHPEYELVASSGKAHDPVLTVRVTVDGVGTATASAHSRKEAEAMAAAKLLSETW